MFLRVSAVAAVVSVILAGAVNTAAPGCVRENAIRTAGIGERTQASPCAPDSSGYGGRARSSYHPGPRAIVPRWAWRPSFRRSPATQLLRLAFQIGRLGSVSSSTRVAGPA